METTEHTFHIKGVLKRVSPVYGTKVYLLLVADGRSEGSRYVIPVLFDMPEYVRHIGDNLTLGTTYAIFNVWPCYLKFSEQMGLVVFRTTSQTTLEKVISRKDIEDVRQRFVDVDKLNSRLLDYVESRKLSSYKGTVSKILNEECGFYVLDGKVTLVTLPWACRFQLPRLAVGDRLIVTDCHRVDDSGRVHLVMCFASGLRLVNKRSLTVHLTHCFHWIWSLHCGSLYFSQWLRRTLQTFTDRFVRSYLKPEDLVSYDKDDGGERKRSLIFNLLRLYGPWLRQRTPRLLELEFFSQPHQCTALEEEDPRLTSLEWPSVETMCKVVKFKSVPFSVAPTWRIGVVPLRELPFQVVGCLGQSKDGTLHLCDRSGQIRLRCLTPAKSLPLGSIVVVSGKARFILESTSTMRRCSVGERHAMLYMEAQSFTPIMKAIPAICPHILPPPQRPGRWQAFQVNKVSLPHTLGGRHAFQVTCAFPREEQQRVVLFPDLRWLPILKPGGEFRIQLPPNASNTALRIQLPSDASVRSVPSREASKMDFSSAIAASSIDAGTTIWAIVMDKFYQDARTAQAGPSSGLDKWSPCLKVQRPETGVKLSVYLKSMTASVPLLGLLPGALIRLEGLRHGLSQARNPYAMSVNNTVLDVATRERAVHTYRMEKRNWPIPGGPLNGISYMAPPRWHYGFIDSVESLRIWPDCRFCCREIGQHDPDSAHVPVPTAFLRFTVLCGLERETTVVCWDDDVRKVLDFPDSVWKELMDHASKSIQCVEYSIRNVREVTDSSGRQVVEWGWTPLEKDLADWCTSSFLLRFVSFRAREMRFPEERVAKAKGASAVVGEQEMLGKRRFHATAFEDVNVRTLLRLRNAYNTSTEKLRLSKTRHLRRFPKKEAVVPHVT